MDRGAEPLTDEAERRAIAAQARRVHRRAALLALLLTAGVWAI